MFRFMIFIAVILIISWVESTSPSRSNFHRIISNISRSRGENFTNDVNDYKKIGVTSESTTNVIYVRHVGTNKECVLKFASNIKPKPDGTFCDMEEEDELIAVETELLRKLNSGSNYSPFIVQLFHSFEYKNRHYEVLEWIRGTNLLEAIHEEGRMTHPMLQLIAAQIVLGLKYIHDKGIFYNDMKLENAILSGNNRLVLIDFGLSSRRKRNDKLTHKQGGGTPEYSPPEKFYGDQLGFNYTADFYSLGVVMYQLYCKEFPLDNEEFDRMLTAFVDNDTDNVLIHNCKMFNEDSWAWDLTRRLAVFRREKRLGNKNGATEVMAHQYFARHGPRYFQDVEAYFRDVQEREEPRWRGGKPAADRNSSSARRRSSTRLSMLQRRGSRNSSQQTPVNYDHIFEDGRNKEAPPPAEDRKKKAGNNTRRLSRKTGTTPSRRGSKRGKGSP